MLRIRLPWAKAQVNEDEVPEYLRFLIQEGHLTMDQLNELYATHRGDENGFIRALVAAAGKGNVLRCREACFAGNFRAVDLEGLDVSPDVAQVIDFELARALNVACIAVSDQGLTLAMAEPYDESILSTVEAKADFKVAERVYALPTDLADFRHTYYSSAATNLAVRVREVVDRILQEAVEQAASDVHFEPMRDDIRVRFRKDGVLYDGFDLKSVAPKKVDLKQLKSSISIVIKNRSGSSGKTMDIAETQKPQDGRIYMPSRDLDLRVSVLPTVHGESIVIRIHSKEVEQVRLERLGFPEDDLVRFRQVISAPYGMVLVSGPTGSGKTTTLYGALQELNDPRKKIVTIEDPVEHTIEGVMQAQANPLKEFTFAEALRSFVRHDPDIILVGEIRDRETATMAVEASLTGHLVLSTVHANDAASTITRLREMGVNPLLITCTCLGTLAQRLIRVNCTACLEPADFSPKFFQALDRWRVPFDERNFRRGVGCERCRGSGYRGRTGIYELIVMTQDIKDRIMAGRSEHEIVEAARRQGTRLLVEDALAKAAAGLTTEEEVWRVTLTGSL